MKIGDFAIVRYDLGGTRIYFPEVSGRLGRVKDATYVDKLSGRGQMSEVELLIVSDEMDINLLRVARSQLEVFGNIPATLENVRAYFDGLKSPGKLPSRLQGGATRLEKDLERVANDYKLLVDSNLETTYPEYNGIEALKRALVRPKPVPSHRPIRPGLYNQPIN